MRRVEGTLNISVNPAGSLPPWNADANLALAAGRAAEVASLTAVETLVTGPEVASGTAPVRVPDPSSAAAQGQIFAQTGAPGLPVHSAQSIAVRASAQPDAIRALPGSDSLEMPEDWFESSMPVKNAPGLGATQPAGPAQFTHASLNLSSRLDGARLVDGLFAGTAEPGRQVRSNQVEFESIPVQILSAEATAGARAAHAALGGHRADWPPMQEGDQLMNEIPRLFAPVPVEPQLDSIPMQFKAVVVNGILMLAAVLGAILLGTLNLRDLPSIETMEMGAGALAILGVLYLIFRWTRPRQA